MVPKAARDLIMREFVRTQLVGLTMRLFVNQHQPQETDATADYREASGGGYAPKRLDATAWRIEGESATAEVSWAFTGPAGKVYGQYVTSPSGQLFLAERFRPPGGYDVLRAGDVIRGSVTFTLRQPS